MEEDLKKKKKRKVGRPKKRGPKKKRKSRAKPKIKIRKPAPHWDWKIISVSNGKQKEYVDKFYDIQMAYERFNSLKEENDKVIFPRRVKNSYYIQESKDEYLLLEKNRDGDKQNGKLRNEYGLLVENISSNKDWVILDKIPKKIEETFWVYGYDPKTDRKTFSWIYENYIQKINLDDYQILTLLIYKNKVLFLIDGNITYMIICKDKTDSFNVYSMLQDWCRLNKKKEVFFLGRCDRIGDEKRNIEKQLMELTGWPLKKLIRSSTRA